MAIKIDDAGIADKLSAIRQQVGGRAIEFIPPPPPGSIESVLEGEEVTSLFHPSGLLIHDGRPVFAYIRDHTVAGFSADPFNLRRVHFAFCGTLAEMASKNRFESRYRVTNRTDNRYWIDVGVGGYRSKERLVLLYPCQNCLARVAYKCFNFAITEQEKIEIVKSFDAKQAMELLWQQFDIFRRQTASLRSETTPGGYSNEQRKISGAFRKFKKFICEECGVRTRLTDSHHKDGDKRNNRYDNLECLCKICHAKKHRHYRISDTHRAEILTARRMQRISAET